MDYQKIAIEILEEVCETDEISEDLEMDLFDAGFIDSLSALSVLLLIEQKLNVTLQPTDIERTDISSVNNFAAFLKKTEK